MSSGGISSLQPLRNVFSLHQRFYSLVMWFRVMVFGLINLR